MQNHLEDEDMIRINKRKMLLTALIILFAGIFDWTGNGAGKINQL